LYNAKYLVSIWSIHHPGLEPAGQHEGFLLYRNRTVQPRAFFVPRARGASDAEAESIMAAGAIDFRREILIDDTVISGPAFDTAATSSVIFNEISEERLEIEVDASASGWLFISDTYYPGWQATLDGRPVKIYRADICGRAIAVGPGRHRIELSFRSRSFGLGMWTSLASLVLIGGGLAFSYIRRRKKSAVGPRTQERIWT
jgi:hypothetical protein